MESEAPTRDFSGLSVSDDPPPPPRKLDFSRLNSGSVGFTGGRGCTNFDDFFSGKPTHQHMIKFYGDNFTVDGGPMRDATDPINIKFLEDIKNYIIPEEFAEDGIHTIQLIRHRDVPKSAALRMPLDSLDERLRIS